MALLLVVHSLCQCQVPPLVEWFQMLLQAHLLADLCTHFSRRASQLQPSPLPTLHLTQRPVLSAHSLYYLHHHSHLGLVMTIIILVAHTSTCGKL